MKNLEEIPQGFFSSNHIRFSQKKTFSLFLRFLCFFILNSIFKSHIKKGKEEKNLLRDLQFEISSI